MAKHKFLKGHSGNPAGRKPLDPAIVAIRNLTDDQLKEVGSLLVKGDDQALKKIVDDPKATVLQKMIASISIKAIIKGDEKAFDTIMNRLIGKPKEVVEVKNTGNLGIQIVIPSNGKEVK